MASKHFFYYLPALKGSVMVLNAEKAVSGVMASISVSALLFVLGAGPGPGRGGSLRDGGTELTIGALPLAFEERSP